MIASLDIKDWLALVGAGLFVLGAVMVNPWLGLSALGVLLMVLAVGWARLGVGRRK